MNSIGDPIDVEVGARVRVRRKSLGITQTGLADALGVTFQQVQKYERGGNRISASTLVRIGAKLGMTVSEMVGEVSARPYDRFRSMNAGGAQELLEAYERISDPATKELVIAMVKALAKQVA